MNTSQISFINNTTLIEGITECKDTNDYQHKHVNMSYVFESLYNE